MNAPNTSVSDANTPTRKLAIWYSKHCNEDWEHTYGIEIQTIDNPGWSLRVALSDTLLAEAEFAPIEVERAEWDWVDCRVKEQTFVAHGGVYNLDEMIMIFLDWAAKSEG